MVMKLEYDRSLHEREYRAGPFEITEEMVQAFNRSIRETTPIFTDRAAAQAAGYRSIVAPPTLCTLLVRQVQLPGLDLKFGRMQFHAGQRVRPRAPIVAGDALTALSRLKEVYPKTGRTGTMVFIVWETTFHNQDGVVVAEVQESYARRE